MPALSLLALHQVGFYLERLQDLAVLYVPKLLSAIVMLIVGWWLIGWGSRLVAAATARLDVSLSSFLTSMFSIALKVLLLMSAAGMVGFETTSFVAIVGAAGLAVGLALQGTLANFAGGVLILIFKPFTVGDVIESQGRTGTVQAIQIFNTILLTPQGDTAILPNGATSNGVIVNKAHPQRTLVDIQLELDSSTDFDALRQQVLPLLGHDNEVPDAPAPQVVLVALKPGATMTVAFRAYAQPGQEENLRNHLMERLQQWFAQKPLADTAPGK
ncbi:mechanosensitive ion channel family protein [Hymenobacter sp. BT559]|uniref:mechanosensitive ion channel family protein n=1 Tax=Hymenobacter sp. BT559 TaxID=2795729 RepID=UPI0018EDC439|nr:mechanosensitive ion channel domain-containing protein [Hymenobacter sp. BT559]MBJ6143697.1 mechanosensitive ion channel [Hymenobacter sp. BT559]